MTDKSAVGCWPRRVRASRLGPSRHRRPRPLEAHRCSGPMVRRSGVRAAGARARVRLITKCTNYHRSSAPFTFADRGLGAATGAILTLLPSRLRHSCLGLRQAASLGHRRAKV
jgi:hypothetical protein